MILDASLASSIVGNAGGTSVLCSVMLTSDATLETQLRKPNHHYGGVALAGVVR